MTITLTAYAALRGVSVKAVSKAVAAGRLVESVARNDRGQPVITDPDLADREWEQNTRQRAERADRPGVPRATPATPPASSRMPEPQGGAPAFNVSRDLRAAAAARREAAQAALAELELEERRGAVVPADEARAGVIAAYSLVKTRLLRVPSLVAQRLPELAAQVVPVVDELLREALEELSIG